MPDKWYNNPFVEVFGGLFLFLMFILFVWPVISWSAVEWGKKWDFHWDPDYRIHERTNVVTSNGNF